MARPREKTDITCQNPKCSHYMKEKDRDIIKKGKNRAGHQQYYCFHCRSYFVETANTPLYHKHLSKREIMRICKLLVEKNGIRSIERITGHHRDTVGRLLEDMAAYAALVNDYMIKDLKLGQFEVDEIWTTIKKNKRKLTQRARMGLKKVMRGFTTA